MTSTRLLRRASFVLLGLGPGACLSLDTGPALSIRKSVAAVNEALPTLASANGGGGTVAVSGRIVGKLPCDAIDGDVKETAGGIRLIVELIADRNVCPGRPPTTWSYVANILNVERGARTVIVEHRFRGIDGQAGVVLDTLVDVR